MVRSDERVSAQRNEGGARLCQEYDAMRGAIESAMTARELVCAATSATAAPGGSADPDAAKAWQMAQTS